VLSLLLLLLLLLLALPLAGDCGEGGGLAWFHIQSPEVNCSQFSEKWLFEEE
jgi:hypothetical protein